MWQIGKTLFTKAATSLIFNLLQSDGPSAAPSLQAFVSRCLDSQDAELRSALLDCILQSQEVLCGADGTVLLVSSMREICELQAKETSLQTEIYLRKKTFVTAFMDGVSKEVVVVEMTYHYHKNDYNLQTEIHLKEKSALPKADGISMILAPEQVMLLFS